MGISCPSTIMEAPPSWWTEDEHPYTIKTTCFIIQLVALFCYGNQLYYSQLEAEAEEGQGQCAKFRANLRSTEIVCPSPKVL